MSHISNTKDHEDAWEDLVEFTESRPKWCEKVASYVMKHRNWNYEKFIKQFMYLALESVGITVWARCYRKHVGFFYNSRFWCTEKNNNLDKCDIFLVFRGHRIFEGTRLMSTTEYPMYQDTLARAQAIIDERELETNC